MAHTAEYYHRAKNRALGYLSLQIRFLPNEGQTRDTKLLCVIDHAVNNVNYTDTQKRRPDTPTDNIQLCKCPDMFKKFGCLRVDKAGSRFRSQHQLKFDLCFCFKSTQSLCRRLQKWPTLLREFILMRWCICVVGGRVSTALCWAFSPLFRIILVYYKQWELKLGNSC